MPQPRQRAVPQGNVGPPSLMAVLVFAALVVLLLYKGYDMFVEPHAAVARAQRIANGTNPFHSPSDLMLRELPGVGPRDTPEWRAFQAKLAAEVAEADLGEGFDYVFYGDSITERWRGTEMDALHQRDGPACADAFEKRWGNYRTALLAISGDQTGHLLWRLANGETPSAERTPLAAIVLIGTNDLGAAAKQGKDPTDAAPDAVRRLTAIVGMLRDRLPGMHIILVAVLPRGLKKHTDRFFDWPNKYTKGINFINEHMERAAAGEANVTFVDCNKAFLRGGKVNKNFITDTLHPNGLGMNALSACYKQALQRLKLMKPEKKKTKMKGSGGQRQGRR